MNVTQFSPTQPSQDWGYCDRSQSPVRKLSKSLGQLALNARSKTKNLWVFSLSISKWWSLLTQMDVGNLMNAFSTSRLDSGNALFSGLLKHNKSTTCKLLKMQQPVKRNKKCVHYGKSLHWLPVNFRVDFKIILLLLNGLTLCIFQV